MADVESRLRGLIERVKKAAARKGGELTFGEPMTDDRIDALPSRVEPHFGEFRYPVPPSYRAFLRLFGPMSVGGYGADDEYDETSFSILDVDSVVEDTMDLVHVPEDVEWETPDGEQCTITTNHLVAFGLSGSDEARWCFDTEAEVGDGELPVYWHHQDEPRAKDVATGRWVDEDASAPDHPDFLAWLEARVAEYER